MTLNYTVRLYFCSCGKLGVLWPTKAPICQHCGGSDTDWVLVDREQLGHDLALVHERLESMDLEVN